jgi:hypothetical protein
MNNNPPAIPMPIVTFGRATNVVMVVLGLILQSPIPVYFLLLLRLAALFGGPRYNLISRAGRLLLTQRLADAELEDMRPVRFNNGLAAFLFSIAALFFALGIPVAGWIFALMVAAASGTALAGFCVGCFMYYQFNLQRYRIFGK